MVAVGRLFCIFVLTNHIRRVSLSTRHRARICTAKRFGHFRVNVSTWTAKGDGVQYIWRYCTKRISVRGPFFQFIRTDGMVAMVILEHCNGMFCDSYRRLLCYPKCPILDESAKRQRFDFAGSVTGVVGLVLVNFAWNQGPSVGWGKPYVYVLLILGILFLVAFLFVEHHAVQPLLPPNTINVETGFTLGCIAVGWSSFGIYVFYIWQFMEVLRGSSPLSATAQFVPVGFSGLCAAITTGFLLSRVKSSYIMLASMTAFTLGTVVIATAPVDESYWTHLFVSLIIMPWGMDMSFPAGTIILSNRVPKGHQGIAASLVNTVINYSISIGLGIAGTVESQVNKDGSDTLKGYRSAWYTGIGLSGMGIVLSTLYVIQGVSKRT